MFFNKKNTELKPEKESSRIRLEIYLKDLHIKQQKCLIHLLDGNHYEGVLSTPGLDFVALYIGIKQVDNSVKYKHVFIPLSAITLIEPL